MHTGEYCDIRSRRYEDLTDRDVIKDEHGRWREVMNVFHDLDELHAEYSPEYLDEPFNSELKLSAESLDHVQSSYVLVRLLVHEQSRDETVDRFEVHYRFNLATVQTLPTYSMPPSSPAEAPAAAGA